MNSIGNPEGLLHDQCANDGPLDDIEKKISKLETKLKNHEHKLNLRIGRSEIIHQLSKSDTVFVAPTEVLVTPLKDKSGA
jgi:hypothetical protein